MVVIEPKPRPITKAIKDDLNARLHSEVMASLTAVVDYTTSKAAMQPVLDELAKDGWVIQGYMGEPQGKPASFVAWETADIIRLQRKMVIQITRTPEHQAAAEAAGEVKVGDNTYESIRKETCFDVCNGLFRAEPDGEQILLDDRQVAVALSALRAKTCGARPANWVRDL